MIDLRQGDCLDVMRTMPDRSVHCCVTSPPYFGLRDYGADGQIGLERTPEEFVAKMVDVFREVRRVLRDDGTLWLNLGDSYGAGTRTTQVGQTKDNGDLGGVPASGRVRGFTKQLLGIPWRVAFALQADGWYLRSDIIWHKPNPMPESVRDRPTKSHEYLFLLSKSERYHYDADAVREDAKYGRRSNFRGGGHYLNQGHAPDNSGKTGPTTTTSGSDPSAGRNRRSVWSVATKPFRGCHFATFPPKLIEPCILAGTSEAGCCRACGKPWERVVERTHVKHPKSPGRNGRQACEDGGAVSAKSMFRTGLVPITKTTGFRPACPCNAGAAVPCTVLDPFNGAGTTGVVAQQHGRDYVGIDLNPEYLALSRARLTPAHAVA